MKKKRELMCGFHVTAALRSVLITLRGLMLVRKGPIPTSRRKTGPLACAWRSDPQLGGEAQPAHETSMGLLSQPLVGTNGRKRKQSSVCSSRKCQADWRKPFIHPSPIVNSAIPSVLCLRRLKQNTSIVVTESWRGIQRAASRLPLVQPNCCQAPSRTCLCFAAHSYLSLSSAYQHSTELSEAFLDGQLQPLRNFAFSHCPPRRCPSYRILPPHLQHSTASSAAPCFYRQRQQHDEDENRALSRKPCRIHT